MRVVLAEPRGFCAGVERAIEIVERALEKYGPPIYVRHEIVHNRHVVDRLRAKGARFVDEIDEIPPGAVTIFSASITARVSSTLRVVWVIKASLSGLATLRPATSSGVEIRCTRPSIRPIVPTISGWPACPIKTISRP